MNKSNIELLKNVHFGETCVVAGLGYSVNAYKYTALFKNYVISVNNADSELDSVDMIYDVEKRPIVNWKHDEVDWVTLTSNSTTEADYYVDKTDRLGEINYSENKITWAYSSIVGAVWLAIYMGFSDVFLVGADFCTGPSGVRYFWDRKDYVRDGWYCRDIVDKTDNNRKDKEIRRDRVIKMLENMSLDFEINRGGVMYNMSPYIKFKSMVNTPQ